MDTSKVELLLQQLGKNAEEVALHLKQKGIKGYPQEGGKCPIANYLKTLGYEYVGVCEIDIGIYDKVGRLLELVPTPSPIADFITDFDRQAYPFLEA